jgi:hypothetical protein
VADVFVKLRLFTSAEKVIVGLKQELLSIRRSVCPKKFPLAIKVNDQMEKINTTRGLSEFKTTVAL